MNHGEKISGAENPETVVSGSFRKYMEQIGQALEAFRKADVKVLAPATKEAVNPDEAFIILATDDPNKPPHKLEMDFMREIRKADFLYVVDVENDIKAAHAAGMKSLLYSKEKIKGADAETSDFRAIPELIGNI